ncbi:hypothetical protein ACE6H2_009405 [Prunus campanulata]
MDEVRAKANKSVTMPKDTAQLWFLNKISFSVSFVSIKSIWFLLLMFQCIQPIWIWLCSSFH